jgi:hypothetical protein
MYELEEGQQYIISSKNLPLEVSLPPLLDYHILCQRVIGISRGYNSDSEYSQLCVEFLQSVYDDGLRKKGDKKRLKKKSPPVSSHDIRCLPAGRLKFHTILLKSKQYPQYC